MSGLYVREGGQGDAVLLLHGLFGNGANLGALARDLQADYRVISPDLPGHGRSAPPQPFDLAGMASALQAWLDAAGIEHCYLVGHSLGGKVAMQLALSSPRSVRALVVADIAPVAYPPRHDAVFAALAEVAAGAPASRAEAQALLQLHLVEPGVVQFLMTSLQRDDTGVYRWRFDPDALAAAYPDLLGAPAGAGTYEGPVLFIKGGESDYINAGQQDAIAALFPQAQLRVLPGTGHWLHAEKPALFNSTVRRFFAAPENT